VPAVIPQRGGASEAEPKLAGKAEGSGGGQGQTADQRDISTVRNAVAVFSLPVLL